MLKALTSFILFIVLTAPLLAADEAPFGRASLALFPHKEHQKNLGGCTECHGAKAPGPIAQFGEKWAHTTCMGCHSENKAGPVECSGCHSQF
ncbi:MAG: hypothetical protein PVSMB11_11010 [Desulfuromonadaceae bacterium]